MDFYKNDYNIESGLVLLIVKLINYITPLYHGKITVIHDLSLLFLFLMKPNRSMCAVLIHSVLKGPFC